MFRSWRSDILAHITDRELDNKVAIQLVKEQTLDNARREVKFQLDLCGGNITYQDLFKHLSITFQGGDNMKQIYSLSFIATSSTQKNWKKLSLMSFSC